MLFEKLKSHNRIPFHMPGHKRNVDLLSDKLPYDIDITEIDGFDNLHNPRGIIKNIEEKIKKLYHSDSSFLLVNGSTCGILAGVYTLLNQGDKVLLSRNCHKSVYNAIKLTKAKAVYLQPEIDEYGIAKAVNADDIKNKIEKNDIKLIVLTSPTYEGVISDIDSICDMAHSKNIPVLVDSAHGAHYFEKSKADIVIMSLHKTLPAMTQCAIANIHGNIVDAEQFRLNLSIFETSSPSYVLMSSIENCIDFIVNNEKLFQTFRINMDKFYESLDSLIHLKVLRYDDFGKIVIFTSYSSINGQQLSEMLRCRYNIEVEMVSKDYILAIATVCDTYDNLDTFANALIEIDDKIDFDEYNNIDLDTLPEKIFESSEINKGEFIDLCNCIGKISTEYIWAYPPGIPLLVPGEIVSDSIVNYINNCFENNIEIFSTYGKLPSGLFCLDNNVL